MSGDNIANERAFGGRDSADGYDSQESDLMDASSADELAQGEERAGARSPQRADRRPGQGEASALAFDDEDEFDTDVVLECEAEIDDSGEFDDFDDDEEMTIVDPFIDKAAREDDDPDLDDDLDDSEFDDDMQLDELEGFLSDDPEGAEDLMDLDDVTALDGDIDADFDPDVVDERKIPKTASQQALEARRAIEERAEARRMERDLNYLDFELDD